MEEFLDKNIMKYRIKETVNGNGISTFRIQEKILWWWMKDIHIWKWTSKEGAENYMRLLQTEHVKYHAVEQ